MTTLPEHHCHAIGCVVRIRSTFLMCAFHWFKVPRRLRDAVWAAYRPGQEVTLDPSPEWVKAAEEARQWVAEREGRRPPTLEPGERSGGTSNE